MIKWTGVFSLLICLFAAGCSDAGSSSDESRIEAKDAGTDAEADAADVGNNFADAAADVGNNSTDAAADTGREDNGERLELEELADAFAVAYCAQVFGCCTDSERNNAAYGNSETEAECVDTARYHFNLLFVSNVRNAEHEGRLRYNEAVANECLTRLKQSCDALPTGPQTLLEHCQRFIEPLLEAGDKCVHYYSCKTNHCDGVVTVFEDVEQEGICAESKPGDECQAFGCSDGQYCDVDPELHKFVCFELRANGEPCRDTFECISSYCSDLDRNAGDFDGFCAPKPLTCTGSD